MGHTVQVAVEDATLEQLAVESVRLLHVLNTRFELLEIRMSALTETVTALQGAVDGVAQRLLPQLATLETQLADALADDAEAAAAVVAIRTEVDRLNALGGEPSTPVDTAAPDAATVPEVEVVSEPEAPVA